MKEIDTRVIRGEFTKIRDTFLSESLKKCQNCDETENLEVHHIVPIIYGGTNKLTNLSVLCVTCHGWAHGSGDGLKRKALQARGREAAKARGVKFGPKVKHKPEKLAAAAELARRPDMSVTAAARQFGCSRATLYNYMQANPQEAD